MLSSALRATISQTLLKRIEGGRVSAYEIMICNTAVSALIRDNKIQQVASAMQTGHADGMQTMSNCIKQLFNDKVISAEVASKYIDT